MIGGPPQNQKDLIVLVADKNMEAAIQSVFKRHESLDIRQVNFDIYVHPYHDPGCRLESHSFLLPFSQNYLFAVVMFDREGCGDESKSMVELESHVENLLSNHGWGNRCCAIVIDPELESWVWKNSPHVSNAIGWENRLGGLYSWLREQGFLGNDGECLKQWAHEVHDVREIVWKTLLVKLPSVETIHK